MTWQAMYVRPWFGGDVVVPFFAGEQIPWRVVAA